MAWFFFSFSSFGIFSSRISEDSKRNASILFFISSEVFNEFSNSISAKVNDENRLSYEEELDSEL